MAFANTNYTDIFATTIEKRSPRIADNVLNNNPITAQMKKKGRIVTFDGGHKIIDPLSFAQNANGGAYSGYDTLPTAPSDVISASEWDIKQYAVPVVASGLEMLQNAGESAKLDLFAARMEVAESTMANIIEQGVYNDGTGYQGKAITGLAAIVEATATASQTSTVGNISRTTYSFWRNYCVTGQTTNTAATIQGVWNTAWANLVRGADRPDLIVAGAQEWARFLASLQTIQRFTEPGSADLGFPTIKYMTADVVLGAGIGGPMTQSSSADTDNVVFLNTKYLKFRPHSARNMRALPRRFATNQDAEVTMLVWAGNLTCSGAQFQGRYVSST